MESFPVFRNVLIVAEIEGSSGCWRYRASAFMTREWVRACETMTADVAAVVHAFLDAGVQTVGDRIRFEATDIHHLYHQLIRICYLTPWIEKRLKWLLPLFNLKGRLGMGWLRRQLKQRARGGGSVRRSLRKKSHLQ